MLPPFRIERFFAEWEFTVRHVLCASDVETVSLAELLSHADAETQELWRSLRLGYTESSGHPLLRAEIARLYDDFDAEQVTVFCGAEEAIFAVTAATLERGAHAVVVGPTYESHMVLARATGAEVTVVPMTCDAGWRLDLERLRGALRANTRLVTINFPNNPTGAMIGADELREIVAMCESVGARLFSDEVYRLLEPDEVLRLPPSAELSERAASLGVMSKAYGLAGLRIGWIATRDVELTQRVRAFKDYTTICAAGPSEILALIGLRAADALLARNRDIVRGNTALLGEFFAEHAHAFEWIPPVAGSTAFPRLLLDRDVKDFALQLVQEEGVLLLPGEVFDMPRHFRVGLGRADTGAALDRFRSFMRRR
jgi:aspartate/methionine/tyrosine aminotransferase